MKYTKDDLAKMSDEVVELTLARAIRRNTISISDDGLSDFEFSDIDIMNWNDIMPLAVEHVITYFDNEEAAYHDMYILNGAFEYGIYFKDLNPQRAIACCLILVLQERE